jgi:mannitol/fructose-specific phosphotransferase system IIA component (Ntr-type)
LAVARLARPVDFGAQDSVPVDLVFMIAGSRDNASQHLQLLSKLARMAHDPSFRKAAREAVDAPSLARLLRERE